MKICIFGDSITWGACDNINGGWATLLRNRLAGDHDVYNCGISGDNTEDLLARFEVELTARKGKGETLVLFAIGINDSQYSGTGETRVSEEQFVNNLNELIKQAKTLQSKIVFVGLNNVEDKKLTPIPWSDKNQNYDNDHVRKYNALIEKVASTHGLPFINIFNLLSMDDLEDGLHPNTQGHKKLSEKIHSFLKEEIR